MNQEEKKVLLPRWVVKKDKEGKPIRIRWEGHFVQVAIDINNGNLKLFKESNGKKTEEVRGHMRISQFMVVGDMAALEELGLMPQPKNTKINKGQEAHT